MKFWYPRSRRMSGNFRVFLFDGVLRHLTLAATVLTTAYSDLKDPACLNLFPIGIRSVKCDVASTSRHLVLVARYP